MIVPKCFIEAGFVKKSFGKNSKHYDNIVTFKYDCDGCLSNNEILEVDVAPQKQKGIRGYRMRFFVGGVELVNKNTFCHPAERVVDKTKAFVFDNVCVSKF